VHGAEPVNLRLEVSCSAKRGHRLRTIDGGSINLGVGTNRELVELPARADMTAAICTAEIIGRICAEHRNVVYIAPAATGLHTNVKPSPGEHRGRRRLRYYVGREGLGRKAENSESSDGSGNRQRLHHEESFESAPPRTS